MERDPLRLAWKTAPVRHALAGLLLFLAGLLLFVELHLVRSAVDDIVGTAASSGAFLRLALDLPAISGAGPVVLFGGIPLERPDFVAATLGGLVAVPALIALLLIAVDWIASGIGSRVLARLRSALLQSLLAAPAPRDEAVQTSVLAADVLARESGPLGAAVLTTLRWGGTLAVGLVYGLFADWRLAVVLALVVLVGTLLNSRRVEGRLETARARRSEGASIEQSLTDLLRRLPALRAHGTGRYERERMDRAMSEKHRAVEGKERRFAVLDVAAAIVLLLAPLAVLASGIWLAAEGTVTLGTVLALTLAAGLAALAVREITRWRRAMDQIRPLLVETARGVTSLQTQGRQAGTVALPRSGALVAQNVSAYDPASGARVSGVDVSLALPAHVALVGDGDAGPRVLAALVGGQLPPSTGRLSYGSVDLASADPAERAHRIAFAGGETILVRGSLRENLLYGCPATETELDARLSEAITVAGLDRLIHARGLAGTFDPNREPKLAAAIVEARRAVQAALSAEGLDRYVDPFDAARYNQHATIGENLLFGKPIGDTFREDNLASHPFVRAILEAEDLTKPLARIGLSIATSMIEIFADVPDGHPLFERFSFFAASDRPYFEDLVERRSEGRRGAELARDRERLIGLALRYSESRHRLGLIDEALQQRLLVARADFAKMLPMSLQPSIEFYDQNRLCSAASIQDNLLFGRVASDLAGAEGAIQSLIRRVLTERGLDADVFRIGLETAVDIHGADLTLNEIAAIDVVRCLVRRPDVLIVERALDGLTGASADALVARLRRAMVGRGLVLVSSALSPAMDNPPFDAVIRFERGAPQVEDRRMRREEPVPA
jgi:ABC-type multidrug transport system fused ATPase/permease subunit